MRDSDIEDSGYGVGPINDAGGGEVVAIDSDNEVEDDIQQEEEEDEDEAEEDEEEDMLLAQGDDILVEGDGAEGNAADVEPGDAADSGAVAATAAATRIKRPSSAWMIYVNDQRERMRRDHPGMSIGEVAKALSAEYKALAPEAAEKYLELARKDKERYAEAMRNAPPAPAGTGHAKGGLGEPIPAGEIVFPLVSYDIV